MVIILYQRGCQDSAKEAAADLTKAFADHVKVRLIAATSSSSWPTEVSWDDLLIVMYNGQKFPDAANSLITKYLRARRNSAILLPVAIDKSAKKPPKAAEKIKALEYDKTAKGPTGALVNRAGAMLGLRVQGRDSKIFISYRASDGAKIAKQLHAHLVSLGHSPFLDEAKDVDGATKILPGSPVQKQIEKALTDANLVLLIDTPAAPESKWIMHEVETADSLLLPILPICFRDAGDKKPGPRFRSLLALQRWVQLQTPAATTASPLSVSQLNEIVSAAEQYLCEIFQRKCRVPFLVKKEFLSHHFAWRVLNKHLLMFQSSKGINWRLTTKVVSHCSAFDQIYTPAIKRFRAFLKSTKPTNFSLFIYDGNLLPEPQLKQIAKESGSQDDKVIILHHQELAALIDSNFTTLVAA